ncbi:hypothetical protein [Dactylosporangium sp. NPDC000521]|uniref:hypothetical protein n=1 Tax=Dactylosporangium sp. NPDC000521 TaxID=3363975 RepID=UPI00368BE85C
MDADWDESIRQLREQATSVVAWWPQRTPFRSSLYNLTRGRIDRRPRYNTTQLPTLDSPWQDTPSGRYFGWRCRQANYRAEEFAFVVEYVVCPHCKIGWVDKPYTIEHLQRRGLAAAGLAALQQEHPGVAWHTGSGHMRTSKAFWAAVGRGVLGSYLPRELCEHVERQGGLKPDWLLRREGLIDQGS